MTEPSPNGSQPVEHDFDEEFDAWLAGAAIAQRSVVIYSKPQLYARFQDLERRRKNLVAALGKDAAQSDEELEAIDAEYQELYDEWMESKSTWYIHALTDDDKGLVREGIPSFDALPKDATDAIRAKRAREIEAAQLEANLRTIAAATMKIEFHDRTLSLPPVTKISDDASKAQAVKDVDRIVNKLRGMLRALGDRPMLDLMVAIADANEGAGEITPPKSRKPSESGQA